MWLDGEEEDDYDEKEVHIVDVGRQSGSFCWIPKVRRDGASKEMKLPPIANGFLLHFVL